LTPINLECGMQEQFQNFGRTVAICDHPDAVEFLLGGGAGAQRIDDWLALTPPTGQALAERGINYLAVDDFFAEADLLGNIDDRLRFQVEWAIWLDQYLQSRIPQFAQVNFIPGLALLYQIKTFFDRVRVHSYSLGAFLSSYLPAKIIWVPTSRSVIKERHTVDFHYVDHILPALAGERNIELAIVQLPDEDSFSFSTFLKSNLRQIKSLLKETARQCWVRAKIRYQGWRVSRQNRDKLLPLRPSYKARLLAMQDIYDLPFVLPHLFAAGLQIYYPSLKKLAAQSKKIKDDEIETALKEVWQEIITEPQFWALLEEWQQGREIVKPWLARLWFQAFFEYWQGLQQGREYLKNQEVHGILVANTLGLRPFRVGVGFLHAARLAKTPIFSSPHGTLPGYCQHPLMALLDLPLADFHLAHGVGLANYLHEVAERFPLPHATTVALGSPTVDGIAKRYNPRKAAALREKLVGSEDRPLVLHIPGFLEYHRRLGGDALSCMPYFTVQKQVVEMFAQFRNIRLVYRSFPGQWSDLMPKLVKQYVPEAIIAGSDIKLADLVWAVDGIILDYPATPLSEVLLTNKPIIVFSDKRYYKMFETAKVLLRKRATLAETPEEYLAAIREFLTKGEFNELSSPNNEFRRYYITDKDDGRAAERVADYILDTIGYRK
jgi:hypothetical protein